MAVSPILITVPTPVPDDPLFASAGKIVRVLRSAGHVAYFAGGFARDILIGRAIHDIDIATSAKPAEVQTLFAQHRGFGKSFGVIQVDMDGHPFDIATFRVDKCYRDGRHPEEVSFTTADEDASRRDFTVNGMFYDPAAHQVIDYVGGYTDLQQKVIRAIGDPELRFEEDHLRIMRAVRFASVLEFRIEPATWQAIQQHAGQLAGTSMERIREELIRTMMESPRPGDALHLLKDSGILAIILPEAQAMAGVAQPPEYHPEGDVFTHTALMLNLMEDRTPALIWSILLHDIAKPPTYAVNMDKQGKPRIQFQGHAELGAEMAVTIMKRFRCSNEDIDNVSTAVRNHMKFMAVPEMKNSTLRKWAGSPTFPLELELHRIDCTSSHNKLDHYFFVREFQQQLKEEPVLPPALIRGHDLMEMGFKSGPAMGRSLKRIYDAQLEGAFNNREQALDWVREHIPISTDVDERP